MVLREIRRAKNITQQQLGDAIGVNNSIISKYEKGLVVPPADKLARMAEFLKVSIDDLIHTPTQGTDCIQADDMPRKNAEFPKEEHEIEHYSPDSDIEFIELPGTTEIAQSSFSVPIKSSWEQVDLKTFVALLSLASPSISQAQLAKRLNISPITLSRIVNSNNPTIRKEWIPVLQEYLHTIDFLPIDSTVFALKNINNLLRKEADLNAIILLLQRYFISHKQPYVFDQNYWGLANGTVRFYNEDSNNQWLFISGHPRDASLWRIYKSGLGPFAQFRRFRSSLFPNDKVSIVYFDTVSFNHSVRMSSYPKEHSENCYSNEKLHCYQSLLLCNLENNSVEEYELTDCNGDPLE